MSVSAGISDAAAHVVLLVEDEAMLRQVVALTLRKEGFVVIEAEDGAAGLAILESQQPIDLLLTDIRMPRLNGYQLAEESLKLRTEMPVILMTGYTEEEMPDAIRAASIPMIRKPFNFATLGGSLRDIIEAR